MSWSYPGKHINIFSLLHGPPAAPPGVTHPPEPIFTTRQTLNIQFRNSKLANNCLICEGPRGVWSQQDSWEQALGHGHGPHQTPLLLLSNRLQEPPESDVFAVRKRCLLVELQLLGKKVMDVLSTEYQDQKVIKAFNIRSGFRCGKPTDKRPIRGRAGCVLQEKHWDP